MLIIGAKGFAKEVLEVFHQNNELNNICFFDNVSNDLPDLLYEKFSILNSFENVSDFFKNSDCRFVLGVGNPVLRKQLFSKMMELGGIPYTVISPFSHIGNYGVKIGNACNIMTGSIITNDVLIGDGVLVNLDCTIGHDVVIGNFCELSPSVNISGGVQMGHSCTIGTGAIILPKIKIGNNVVVGAGAVVTKDIPDNSLAVGVPAKIIKSNI